jgi:hypothetical protein
VIDQREVIFIYRREREREKRERERERESFSSDDVARCPRSSIVPKELSVYTRITN